MRTVVRGSSPQLMLINGTPMLQQHRPSLSLVAVSASPPAHMFSPRGHVPKQVRHRARHRSTPSPGHTPYYGLACLLSQEVWPTGTLSEIAGG